MVKSLPCFLVFVLATFMVAESLRKRVNGGTKKCEAKGKEGKQNAGLSITWGYKNFPECAVARQAESEGLTYKHMFTHAFIVFFEHNKCKCRIENNGPAKKDQTIVTFKPKNVRQAKLCAGRPIEDEVIDPMEIKAECWEAYRRGRGTAFVNHGDLSVPQYTPPWMSGDFVVQRGGACEGDACTSINVPRVLEGMSRDDKKKIGGAIKLIMDGKKDEVPDSLIRLIDILPDEDLDDSEFQQIDLDGNGMLSVDELSSFYDKFCEERGCDDTRTVIAQFVQEVDTNGNGEVDFAEFEKLKDKMRDYDPQLDLIDGAVDWWLSPKGVLHEMRPEWKVATVKCMKDGVEVDAKECNEIKAEDAITAFNLGC
jgi:hypothetical protein